MRTTKASEDNGNENKESKHLHDANNNQNIKNGTHHCRTQAPSLCFGNINGEDESSYNDAAIVNIYGSEIIGLFYYDGFVEESIIDSTTTQNNTQRFFLVLILGVKFQFQFQFQSTPGRSTMDKWFQK